MTDQLTLPPVSGIRRIVDVLDDLGIDPLHLHADGRTSTDERHHVRLWLRYRSDYERVVEELSLTSNERIPRQLGQREWYAERDDEGMRLLVSCVSFKHHPDWQPRESS